MATGMLHSYTVEKIIEIPKFRNSLASAAQDLLDTHLALPREVHYVADLQRWMLSQMTIAMHFQHLNDPASLPISPSNLVRAVGDTGIASRNTVHTFLMEMQKYRFVVPLERADRRERALKATEMSEQLIRRYFDIHLRALDIIDNGTRYATSSRYPELLQYAQPHFTWLLVNRKDWHTPTPSIAKFVSSDSGSSILHDLIRNVPHLESNETRPIWIGKVSPQALSSRYRISRTHTARLFAMARETHLIGWAKKSNRGDCWISPQLVRDYLHWQAIKLSFTSKAFEDACRDRGILRVSPLE